MGNCEMCGSESSLFHSLVEGVELKVCKNCASFGKKINKPIKTAIKKIFSKKPEREIIQSIVEDFPKLIRQKREKMGLKQKEFARFLAERESIIHKMESGSYTPSIELARKLEKQLGLSLIEQNEIKPQKIKASKEKFTIGDMIKIK